MEKVLLGFEISNPSEFRDLAIECWIDKTCFFDNSISPGRHYVKHEIQCDEGQHYLYIKFKNKTHAHTQVDQSGEIVKDAVLRVENFSLDGIAVDKLMFSKAEYVHDGNGSHVIRVHPFYGDFGCNGTVQLCFNSPVYLWLLENI